MRTARAALGVTLAWVAIVVIALGVGVAWVSARLAPPPRRGGECRVGSCASKRDRRP